MKCGMYRYCEPTPPKIEYERDQCMDKVWGDGK